MDELLSEFGVAATQALPSAQATLLYLLLAFVLGKALAWVYIRTHRGVSYSRSTTQALVLLCLIVTLVMLAIGESMARAFGLFGALALIRFRTPVKDTRDTVFLFLAVAMGISVGSQNLLLSATGGAFVLLVALYLDWVRFGQRVTGDGVLRLSLPGTSSASGDLHNMLKRFCRSFSVLQVREGLSEGELELAYQLEMSDPGRSVELIADVRALAGARDVSISMQTEHEEL